MKFLLGYSHKNKQKVEPFQALGEYLRGESDEGEVTNVQDWISALGYLALEKYTAVWMDWQILRRNYADFHRQVKKINAHLPLLIITDNSRIDGQLCFRNELIFGVLPANQMLDQAALILQRLETYYQLLSETTHNLKRQVRPNGFNSFIGNSPSMLEIYRQIIKVAPTNFTVLITGASGSGKELVARTIHEFSPRQAHPFVSLNCAAIPDNLLESELFGYEKGAYTGATQPKPGKFEQAHRGTILLDEIGDMPPNLQAKLLRVLEDHTVERLGGTKPKAVDIRLLAATNQDLAGLIKAHKFRSDLHYRLNVIPLALPSLRNKPEDIFLLTISILSQLLPQSGTRIDSISWELIQALQSTAIAGNVRELENILTRVIFQASGPDLTRETLEAVLTDSMPETEEEGEFIRNNDQVDPLWRVEKLAIAHALARMNGNITRVAAQLEISRTALYRKMKKYHLEK